MKGSPEALLRYFELVKPSAFGDSPSKALFKKPPDQPGVHPPMNSVEIGGCTPGWSAPTNEFRWNWITRQRRPWKKQIYVGASLDDPCFAYTEESLKALVKFWWTCVVGRTQLRLMWCPTETKPSNEDKVGIGTEWIAVTVVSFYRINTENNLLTKY